MALDKRGDVQVKQAPTVKDEYCKLRKHLLRPPAGLVIDTGTRMGVGGMGWARLPLSGILTVVSAGQYVVWRAPRRCPRLGV